MTAVMGTMSQQPSAPHDSPGLAGTGYAWVPPGLSRKKVSKCSYSMCTFFGHRRQEVIDHSEVDRRMDGITHTCNENDRCTTIGPRV